MTAPSAETQPNSTIDRAGPWEELPEIDLRQLIALTDDTGIFQHAVFAAPDPNHGYCIDDNARALIAALLYAQLRQHDERTVPLQRYLAFLAYAWNDETKAFRNFMGYDRHWLEEVGSQDSQGRTLWALGLTIRHAPNDTIRELAHSLIEKGLSAIEGMTFIRSWAFALIGLNEFLAHEPNHDYALKLRAQYAEKLFDAYQAHATDDWPWWEDTVTYDNAKLSQALLECGEAMGRPDMLEAGLTSLRWLLKVQTAPQGHLSIIGNDGWLNRNGKRAVYDQQPLEAYAMVHACLTAAKQADDPWWAKQAWTCFEWFIGRNDLGVPLYHPDTGGCQDGLQADGPNKNQGAESSLAYLLSVLEMHLFHERKQHRVEVAAPTNLGYAIIGASKFAEFCMESYAKIDGLKPVAVWNRTGNKAKALADKHNLTAYDTLDDLLHDPSIHMVHVASTPAQHADHTLAALRAGKHVLCEKPIAIDPADAHAMLQAAGERDRILAVNFVMRYGPLADAVGKIIASEALGAPLRGYVVNKAGDSGLPTEHWFWNEEESGGIFIEHGVHFFDLVRSWLGEARVLSALRLRRPDSDTITDQVAADLRYSRQTTVNFYHGFHQSPHLDQQDIRLIFERGELRVTGWVAQSIEVHAVLDENDIDTISNALPGSQTVTLETFDDHQRSVHRRHRQESADREVLVTWNDSVDKQITYQRSVTALMEDQLRAIRDRRHIMRVTADDALRALELATEADRIARGSTP